jgi:hypothetical protein
LATAFLSVAGSAFATGLTINSVPASTAVSRVGQAFGTNVSLGLGLNPNQRVSFNIPDTSVVGGRLTAVDYLAHQLNATPRTVLIVDKSNGTAWKAPAALDTTANVHFTSRAMPATAVLHQLAYVDNADLVLNTPVRGYVTLSDTILPANQAAEEVAAQTHTTFSVSYRLTSRTRPVTTATGSTIIGFTPGGQPITSDMVVTAPATTRVYAHRTSKRTGHRTTAQRYAHRKSTGSISITSSSGNGTSTTTATPPITGTPPATLLQPPPPGLGYYQTNQSDIFAPGWPYGYAYPWFSPYPNGGGAVVVAPGGPLGPRVIVP